LLKELQAIYCFIHPCRILKLQVIVIVTGQKTWKTKKAQLNLFFFMRETTFMWTSKKQSIFALSTCEAEYIAAASCVSCNMAKETNGRFVAETK